MEQTTEHKSNGALPVENQTSEKAVPAPETTDQKNQQQDQKNQQQDQQNQQQNHQQHQQPSPAAEQPAPTTDKQPVQPAKQAVHHRPLAGKPSSIPLFKIIMLGASGVGKSSILRRFVHDDCPSAHNTTIGVDFHMERIDTDDGRSAQVQLWDTAGQDRFLSITRSYYRGIHGVILVFDVADKESFHSADTWLGDLDQFCDQTYHPRPVIMLVGNKADLDTKDANSKRQVTIQEASAYCSEHKLVCYFETAAISNGLEIQKAFRHFAKCLLTYFKETPVERRSVVRLDPPPTKGFTCCR